MLIEKVSIPSEELIDAGLQSIEMNRLGQFVALTGKNGAGKSRILSKLEWFIHQRNSYSQNLPSIELSITQNRDAIRTVPSDHPHQLNFKRQLNDLLRQHELATNRIFTFIGSSIGVLRFVPKQLTLKDPRNENKSSLRSRFEHVKKPGLENFHESCFSYIQTVQNREWEASHQRSAHNSSEAIEARNEYERLVTLIESFLKTTIGRSLDADVTIFGKPLAEAGLSDGQKVLIQLAVALHAQKGKLDNTVFILDEPENHLHPSALIEFLDTVGEVAANSQFWIATHSVPLLAHIAQKEPMSIWYVEDAGVSNAGSKPELVLRGLLGNEEQISNLNTFTSLPAQYASINFATECLLEPKTIGGVAGDSQVAQIGSILDLDSGTPTSLMDFGAGKSRLLSGLFEIANSNEKRLADSVSYFAFEPSAKDTSDSLGIIDTVYGSDTIRHFSSSEEFYEAKDDLSIDVAVMCNVLHEIPPNDWLNIFRDNSLIGRALKESGHLLIVEDQRIPTGELAHKFGFFVLDTPHLRTLFSVNEKDMQDGLFISHDHRGDGRLKAHRISKKLLSRINAESRKRAIEQLRETAKSRISELRQSDANYRNGQLHGFWTQQFANASLWLDEH